MDGESSAAGGFPSAGNWRSHSVRGARNPKGFPGIKQVAQPEGVPRHKGGSAVVRQYGLGVSPSGVTAERVPRHKATAVNCRQVAQPKGLRRLEATGVQRRKESLFNLSKNAKSYFHSTTPNIKSHINQEFLN